MRIISLSKAECEIWVKAKHYSHRPSIFWKGFGLVEDGFVTGVVVYGQPSPPIQRHAFKERDFRLYELSRLVVQSKTKNAASFLIANSLKMLDKPCAVVSYADMEQKHCGIVYQATNWLYTGATKSHDHLYIVNGERVHPMTLRDSGITDPKRWAKEHGIQIVKPCEKHRYFFLCGTPKQKKRMLNKLVYERVPYPKCDQVRYDDGENILMGGGSMSCGNCASCSCNKDDVKQYIISLSTGDVRLLKDMLDWAAYEHQYSYKDVLERIVDKIGQQNAADNH